MEKVKAYTDLEQSKKLAEILPLESADMCFNGWAYPKEFHLPTFNKTPIKDNIPCWSLAALLSILPRYIRLTQDTRNCYDNFVYTGEQYYFDLKRCSGGIIGNWYTQYQGTQERRYGKHYQNVSVKLYVSKEYDNPVDACYEMIIKLHEQKLL